MNNMTETEAEGFVKFVLELRRKGIEDDDEILQHLMAKYGTEEGFQCMRMSDDYKGLHGR